MKEASGDGLVHILEKSLENMQSNGETCEQRCPRVTR